MSIMDILQMGETSRLDALWREHERLAARVEVLTELLVTRAEVSPEEIAAALARSNARPDSRERD